MSEKKRKRYKRRPKEKRQQQFSKSIGVNREDKPTYGLHGYNWNEYWTTHNW